MVLERLSLQPQETRKLKFRQRLAEQLQAENCRFIIIFESGNYLDLVITFEPYIFLIFINHPLLEMP